MAEEDLFFWQLDLEFFQQAFDGADPLEDGVADVGVFLVTPIWSVTDLVQFFECIENVSSVGNPHFWLWLNEPRFLFINFISFSLFGFLLCRLFILSLIILLLAVDRLFRDDFFFSFIFLYRILFWINHGLYRLRICLFDIIRRYRIDWLWIDDWEGRDLYRFRGNSVSQVQVGPPEVLQEVLFAIFSIGLEPHRNI